WAAPERPARAIAREFPRGGASDRPPEQSTAREIRNRSIPSRGMSHPWTMVIAVARSGPGRGSGTVGRGGMSVAGEARDEQRDQPRLGIPGRRPTLPGGLRLPLAAAVL